MCCPSAIVSIVLSVEDGKVVILKGEYRNIRITIERPLGADCSGAASCGGQKSEVVTATIGTGEKIRVVPIAACTNIIVTMNARSLLNFFELRCCLHAQWEIRKLANKMLQEVKKVAPTIFKKSGPPCKTRNVCPENKKDCPLYPK